MDQLQNEYSLGLRVGIAKKNKLKILNGKRF